MQSVSDGEATGSDGIAIAAIQGFGDAEVATSPTRAVEIGQSIFERFVIPFEILSVVLLAALIGGIVLARRDPEASPVEASVIGSKHNHGFFGEPGLVDGRPLKHCE